MEDALRMEHDTIVELGETDATQNLIRNFFLAEKYKRGSSKQAAGENHARGGDRRGGDG